MKEKCIVLFFIIFFISSYITIHGQHSLQNPIIKKTDKGVINHGYTATSEAGRGAIFSFGINSRIVSDMNDEFFNSPGSDIYYRLDVDVPTRICLWNRSHSMSGSFIHIAVWHEGYYHVVKSIIGGYDFPFGDPELAFDFPYNMSDNLGDPNFTVDLRSGEYYIVVEGFAFIGNPNGIIQTNFEGRAITSADSPNYLELETNNNDNKIHYTYDATGNLISREIILSTTKSFLETNPTPFFTDQIAERIIKIYPNPTKGQLVVEVSGIQDIKTGNLIVYNMQGQTILNKKISESQTYLDISSHPNGIYILHINIDGKKSSWRIIKE